MQNRIIIYLCSLDWEFTYRTWWSVIDKVYIYSGWNLYLALNLFLMLCVLQWVYLLISLLWPCPGGLPENARFPYNFTTTAQQRPIIKATERNFTWIMNCSYSYNLHEQNHDYKQPLQPLWALCTSGEPTFSQLTILTLTQPQPNWNRESQLHKLSHCVLMHDLQVFRIEIA